MKCLLLLWCACTAAHQAGVAGAGVAAGAACAGPVIHGVHYTDEVLYEQPGLRTLDYDFTSNVLYFTTSDNLFKIDLNSKKLLRKKNWKNTARGASLDHQTGDLYVGSFDGVYKYDNSTNRIKIFGADDFDMLDLFFTDIVYFVERPSYQVHTIVDGKVSVFEDLINTQVRHLVIDNDGYIIFSNDTGLYGQKGGTSSKDAVLYEARVVRDFSMTMNGEVYAAFEDGVYAVDKEKHRVNRILSVPYCTAITFDRNNNIIYSKRHIIHRLVISDDQDCV